jgi:Uncharacterised protein conserved in bacteria (DUF2336)
MLKNENPAPVAPEGMTDSDLLTFVVNYLADRSDRLQPSDLDLATPMIAMLAGRVAPETRLAAAETLRAAGTIPVSVFAGLAVPQTAVKPKIDTGRNDTSTCSLSQLLMIACQAEVPEAQTNLIVARGAAEALVAVVANPGARFAKSSLTTLVELAASDFSLREALCSRGDLPDAILDRLWPYLSPRGKITVLSAGLTLDESAVDSLMKAAEQDLLATMRDGDLPLGLDTCIAQVADGSWTLVDAIKALAAEGRFVDVASLLARRAGIETEAALGLLLGAYDRGCIALARAAEIDTAALALLIDVRARAGARRTPDRRGPMHAFSGMGAHEAAELLAGLAAPGTAEMKPGQDAAAPGGTETPDVSIAA